MAYLGGKSTASEHILKILNNPFFDNYKYIEPFCGYCHILRRVINKKSYTISDNNELLIVLLKHIQKTKNKHPNITQKEYTYLKNNISKNKLRASYAAFCYSYNGKYFGGYVNQYGDRNYPNERKRYYDLLHDNESFKEASINLNDYTKYKNVKNSLIYCDPPYHNTTEYHSSFDSNKFWDFIRDLSKDNYVFISEYTAPKDFICISKKYKHTSLSGKGSTRKRIEKVFVYNKLYNKIKDILNKKKSYKNKTLKKTKV